MNLYHPTNKYVHADKLNSIEQAILIVHNNLWHAIRMECFGSIISSTTTASTVELHIE